MQIKMQFLKIIRICLNVGNVVFVILGLSIFGIGLFGQFDQSYGEWVSQGGQFHPEKCKGQILVPSDEATRDMRGEQGQSYPARRDRDKSVIPA